MATTMGFVNEPEAIVLTYGSVQTSGWHDSSDKNRIHYSQVLSAEDIASVSEYEKYDIEVQRCRTRLQRAAGNAEWDALPLLRESLVNAVKWRSQHEEKTRAIIERHERNHALKLALNKYNRLANKVGWDVNKELDWLSIKDLFIGGGDISHVFLDGRWHVVNVTHYHPFAKSINIGLQCNTIPSLFFKKRIVLTSSHAISDYNSMMTAYKHYVAMNLRESKRA